MPLEQKEIFHEVLDKSQQDVIRVFVFVYINMNMLFLLNHILVIRTFIYNHYAPLRIKG